MLDASFTANARTLGGRQLDALQKITGAVGDFPSMTSVASGAFYTAQAGSGGYGDTSVIYNRGHFDSSRVARASTETRPANVAYHPRIHA
ncbi:hypothetical protein ACOTBZ_17635 [Achromobacter xylosoxidans]